MPQFDLVREPRGQVLYDLIDVAVEACDRFTFERSKMQLSSRAEDVYRRLAPFLIDRAEVSETLGSIMIPPDTVTLYTYRLEPEAAEVLRVASDRLFGWFEPDLPQDLCFLRGHEPWLINSAVDDFACLLVSHEEAAALRAAVPRLSIREVPSRVIWRH